MSPNAKADELDRNLDAILRASGSSLRNYSIQKTRDDMRKALDAAMQDAYAEGRRDEAESRDLDSEAA